MDGAVTPQDDRALPRAATVGKKILFVQGIPAALTMILVWLAS